VTPHLVPEVPQLAEAGCKHEGDGAAEDLNELTSAVEDADRQRTHKGHLLPQIPRVKKGHSRLCLWFRAVDVLGLGIT